jgi:hypothetical protein
LDKLDTDSLLGEAMALRAIVWASTAIRSDPRLAERHERRAEDYLKLSRDTFDKWERRGAWRRAGQGEISIVVPFGIDAATGGWTDGEKRKFDLDAGFSHPANKANAVAMWLLAMAEATGDSRYRERAFAWFTLMKARLRTNSDGAYEIWNYWEPAGPWDYNGTSRPKHWIGIHPNPGYYEIDVRAMVYAHQNGGVFSDDDIARLVRTALSTKRMWAALAPFESEIRKEFEARLDPGHWVGLTLTPWYLSLCSPSSAKAKP